MQELTQALKAEATRLGFDLVGIAPAVGAPTAPALHSWLEAGYAGEMSYLTKRAQAYDHPDSILAGVQSVVLVGMNYHAHASDTSSLQRHVASYAWGRDYHDVLRERLQSLLGWVQSQAPTCRGRIVVDTAPLLERDYARLAGLGWFGKNTMLLHKRLGSFFFLGALLLDVPLQPDAPMTTSHCGTCTACLDACPTDAFVAPYQLDARKCISYLTIELRGPVPPALRAEMGSWAFGCDVCQDVCPWNRKAPTTSEPGFAPTGEMTTLALVDLLRMTEEDFRARFRNTPLWRSKRRGLLRNAAYVLGNQRDVSAIKALLTALHHEEALVRGAAAWALGRFGTEQAQDALRERLQVESDADVREEIGLALADACGGATEKER